MNELLDNFDFFRLVIFGLGAFAMTLVGLAAKEFYPTFKTQPVVWIAAMVAIAAGLAAFREMTSKLELLEPNSDLAALVHVKYAIYKTRILCGLVFASCMALMGAQGLSAGRTHRELLRLHQALAASAQNLAKSDSAANKNP